MEVVIEYGFVGEADDELDFTASYYEEVAIDGFGVAMLRVDEASDNPVGVLVEHFSRLHRRRPLRRQNALAAIEQVVELAHLLMAEVQEEALFTEAPRLRPHLQRRNGGYVYQAGT